jgi:hypothetical protein
MVQKMVDLVLSYSEMFAEGLLKPRKVSKLNGGQLNN